MSMTVLTQRVVATIGGVPVPLFAADTQHGVNQPIGTGSLTLPLPLPDHLLGSDGAILNAPVTLQAGFDGRLIRPIFTGTIDGDRYDVDARARTATLGLRGRLTRLDWTEETDLTFAGPVALYQIVRSLFARRGIASYRLDRITYPDGVTDVLLGGNPDVDDGAVTIPRRTSPLSWLDRKLRLFGYRIFDTPSGEVRVQRVSGLPVGDPAAQYAEGVTCYSLGRTREIAPMVTYWTVTGASYTDGDGVRQAIRSIPLAVPYDPLLDPPGYRADDIGDGDLVNLALADAVRNVAEIDGSAPHVEDRWEVRGDPERQPGEVVAFTPASFDGAGLRWLMSLRQTIDDGGYTAQMSGWAGAGEALPAGSDAVASTLGAGPWHVGDEVLPHYAVPSPHGTTVSLGFTVPAEYTSIAIAYRFHGTNSFLIDGANADSTVSKIEIWQSGEEPVGTAEMAVGPENLLERLDYTNLANWQTARLPIPGQVEPGYAEVRFVSGVDSAGGPDDFEIRDVVITLAGVGTPVLPTGGA